MTTQWHLCVCYKVASICASCFCDMSLMRLGLGFLGLAKALEQPDKKIRNWVQLGQKSSLQYDNLKRKLCQLPFKTLLHGKIRLKHEEDKSLRGSFTDLNLFKSGNKLLCVDQNKDIC